MLLASERTAGVWWWCCCGVRRGHAGACTGGVGPTTSVASAAASARCPTFTSSCALGAGEWEGRSGRGASATWGTCRKRRLTRRGVSRMLCSQKRSGAVRRAACPAGAAHLRQPAARGEVVLEAGGELRVAQQVGQALAQRLPRPRVVAAGRGRMSGLHFVNEPPIGGAFPGACLMRAYCPVCWPEHAGARAACLLSAPRNTRCTDGFSSGPPALLPQPAPRPLPTHLRRR